jgi:hypothetical protein
MNLPADPFASRAALAAARRVDCPECPALTGDECRYTTVPASLPAIPGTPLRPSRGYHAGRIALGLDHMVTGIRRDLMTVTADQGRTAIVWDVTPEAQTGNPVTGPADAGPFETERQVRETPAVRAVHEAFDAAPGVGRMTAPSLAILRGACQDAGVELGEYDARVLAWLAGWGPVECAVIAGLITRARMAGEAAHR